MSPRKYIEPGCTGGIFCPIDSHIKITRNRDGSGRFSHIKLTKGQQDTLNERTMAAIAAQAAFLTQKARA